MSSTTPFGDPPTRSGPRETPIQARKIAALPRHIRERHLLEQSLGQGNDALVLGPFRSLVASPATPNTPTPVPSPGSGHNSVSFNPSPLCGSTTPDYSFSNPSLSPPDSPYPSTPIPSAFDPEPSVVIGNQNDMDPFVTSARVEKAEKTLAVFESPVALKHDSWCVDLRESSSPLNGAEGRPSQTGADVLGFGRPASPLEKHFTPAVPLFFHHPPRQYALARKVDISKSNDGAPNAAYVPRSSPQIIEEDGSDEELEPEDRGNDDTTTSSFPCEDPKINELIPKLASLSLGTCLAIVPPTVTPIRVRACVPALVPVRTPVSSPVAVSHPVVARPGTVEHETLMEVDEGALYPTVVNKDPPCPQRVSEAVPMEGIVFHPEVKDVEMTDAFPTNPKAAPFTSLPRGSTGAGSAFCRLRPTAVTTWNPKSTPYQSQRTVIGAPHPPLQSSRGLQRTVFDFLCRSPSPAVFSGSTVSSTSSHSRFVRPRTR